MDFGAYLEKKQPLVYRSFSRALVNHRLSHAYLLSGEAGTPLKETALFLAKSILCDHPHPLADDTCRSCQRVDHGTYSDLLILDGEASSLKKEDVQEVVSDFTKTPLEEKGIMIYIIHLVENMTVEAVNSLLKFLEEPSQNTYAILTTQNEARVLPTIVSRCESMRMLLSPREEVIQEAEANGVSLLDAELLSYFVNSGELIALEAKEEDYLDAKTAFEASLQALSKPRSEAIYLFESSIIPNVGSKEDARYYLDMLSLAYQDLAALKEKRPIKLTSYVTLLTPLASLLPHPNESLLEIMKVRSQLDLNLSVALLLEHLVNYLTKEL
jgi:DNA polymerase III subunit delta'